LLRLLLTGEGIGERSRHHDDDILKDKNSMRPAVAYIRVSKL